MEAEESVLKYVTKAEYRKQQQFALYETPCFLCQIRRNPTHCSHLWQVMSVDSVKHLLLLLLHLLFSAGRLSESNSRLLSASMRYDSRIF